jgi:signal transduction histidine kinase
MQFLLVDPHIMVLGCCSALLMCGLTAVVVRQRKNLFAFLVTSWITLFGILIAGAYSVNHAAYIAQNGLQNKLSSLAKSFAVALKDAGHEKVLPETPEDELYQKLINMMIAWQQNIPTVASIYTMRQNDNGEIVFICCPPADLDRNGKIEGEREQLVPKGKVYEYDLEEDIQEIFDAFGGKSGFNNVPSPDEWGLWITATEPIFDETGEYVHAVLGVDFWGEDWNADIRRAVLWPRLFLLSAVFIFFAVQVFVFRRQIVEDQLTEYATHLEQVMDELVAAKKAADVAAHTKSCFLANISHEIRTPLNAILGIADVLINTGVGKSAGVPLDHTELVDIMRKSSSQLLSLIDDVLTFSSIEAHRIVLESVPIRPRQLIEDVKKMTSSDFAEKPNVKFHGECEASVPEVVLGDPIRIRQILLCLVSNAVKFTSAGHATVRCSVTHLTDTMALPMTSALSEPSRSVHLDPRIAQSKGLRGAVPIIESLGQQTTIMGQSFSSLRELSPDSLVLRFDVSDTGIGIARERFDSLFEMFSQEDNSSTRQFGGIGLGLNVVKGLVQLMNGKVQVESKLGRGSTFSVLIPAIPVSEQRRRSE